MRNYLECNCCRAVRDDVEEIYNPIIDKNQLLCSVCQNDLETAKSLGSNPFFDIMIERKVKEILESSNDKE